MFPAASIKFLEDFLKASGPSGFEFEQAAIFRKYLSKYTKDIEVDNLGNSIVRLNPKAKFQVMLAGHYDEIGFQVVNIMDEGLISFRSVGGIDPLTVPGIEVEIITAKGRIPGVIGRKPIHLQTPEERTKVPELKRMWIDIGATSKKEAEKMVSVGDPVAFRANFRMLSKNRVMSKGLDDKIGAFVIAEAFRIVAQSGKLSKDVGVACVGTVQEELGLRGATAGAFGVNPNVGIAVDVGFATEVPGISADEYGVLTMGKGPGLTRNADNNPPLLVRITKLADKKKLPYQLETGHRSTGGTDTAALQLTRGGVATALFSIPNRYMHTPVEICDLRDAENAAKIIAETILSFKGDETFRPGLD